MKLQYWRGLWQHLCLKAAPVLEFSINSGLPNLTPDIPVRRICHWVAIGSLVGLIVLCLAWEISLAPLRPGGSWLMLKVVPLLLPLFGILRGERYTYQWASMFVLFYFTEGVVRAWSDRGLSASLAVGEIILSVVFFVAALAYARLTRPAARPNPNAGR